MRVIAVYNLKGGVGKTSTAVNLAYLSARDGRRTLLWDLDPQGAASYYYRVKPKVKGGASRLLDKKKTLPASIKGTDFDNLDLMPADFSYRDMDLDIEDTKKPEQRIEKLLKPLRKSYDHVILDCPDSMSALSRSVFHAADLLLVPVIPTTLSMLTLERLRKYFEKGDGPAPILLPFFCMVDRRKRMHRDFCDLRRLEDNGFLSAEIPYASAVERMGIERAPLVSYDRRSNAAKAYRDLWQEVQGYIGSGVLSPGS